MKKLFVLFGCLIIPGLLFCQTVEANDIRQVSELPAILTESSGLVCIDDSTLVSHNDSGGDPELLFFRPGSKELTRKVRIKGVKNKDWEEITADEHHIYIGDFGNNFGSRKDLVIYKISREDVRNKDHVEAEKISFSYPEQNTFLPSYVHNFDCEAMIVHAGRIFLFTKNRADGKSNIYTIPLKPGDYKADLEAQLDVKGLITGASMNEEKTILALIGYTFLGANRFHPFIYLITDFEGHAFADGRQRRFDLPVVKQTEAICFVNGTTVYFTEEEENNQTGYLYELNLANYLKGE